MSVDLNFNVNSLLGVATAKISAEKQEVNLPLSSYHESMTFQLHNELESYSEEYSHNRSSIPTFQGTFFAITPQEEEIPHHLREEAVVKAVGTFWNKGEFSRCPHTPVKIGQVEDSALFGKRGVPRSIHLPVKLPGSDIRVPDEYKHFSRELEKIFAFERSINPMIDQYYAYLTVDQGFVPKANYQRVPGPHVDGIPRDRESPEMQLVDHAYLVTDAIPTIFYPQRFDMEPYDLKRHNFFAIFRALADESRSITTNPLEINLMDGYSVHTPSQTLVDVYRTFIRLEFSTLEFDREGNSVNPSFAEDKAYPHYPFRYRPRPIPNDLTLPPSVFDEKPVSSRDFLVEEIDDFGRGRLRELYLRDERVVKGESDYCDLQSIAQEMDDPSMKGIVISRKTVPYAFLLYSVDRPRLQLHTFFTLSSGRSNEAMVYGLSLLKKRAEEEALRGGHSKGEFPLLFVESENNRKMLPHFSRAARLAKVDFKIHYLQTDRSLFEELQRKTEYHRQYLIGVGLGERAKGIDVTHYRLSAKRGAEEQYGDFDPFTERMAIPEEVIQFDTKKKNTLVTTDPNSAVNKGEDVERILDIRLYPPLRELIAKTRLELFVGSLKEMDGYYSLREAAILFEFTIPSSARYFLARTKRGDLFVIMGNLVSRENIIAQLITLKFGGIGMEKVSIIGSDSHFTKRVEDDIRSLLRQVPQLMERPNILVVAGCGLEQRANRVIANVLKDKVAQPLSFCGDIISLTYFPPHAEGAEGLISLDLKYGDVMEEIVTSLLESANIRFVYTGGAGGYIPKGESDEKIPSIGERVAITDVMNSSGERVSIKNVALQPEKMRNSPLHLHVPTIFMETYEWLAEARGIGRSVDIETFYIIKAIYTFNQKAATAQIRTDCGYFVSDYVGEKPLREYSQVFVNYEMSLENFIKQCIPIHRIDSV